jgi:N-acetylglucosaminyldiphosphoundecaprenol N-acetyl-beta-D-mannosaminyltransferase
MSLILFPDLRFDSVKRYFGIKYEFEKQVVLDTIDQCVEDGEKGYVCVADGVTLAMSRQYPLLKTILEFSVLNICDSGWVPFYIKRIYHIRQEQYSGTELFEDVVSKKKYKMMFLGTSNTILKPLRDQLSRMDDRILDMPFAALPFRNVEEFDYREIASRINEENPDIIWVSLGMPKQEIFMYNLLPEINQGILIGVGAVFKFKSGLSGHKRAPQWMVKCKLEWLYRIFSEPRKQFGRCWLVIRTTPGIIYREYRNKKKQIKSK